METIHPTAVVHPDAHIAEDVVIGPWVLIEAGANIGPGCQIHAQAQILNSVEMGQNCSVHAGAVIGGDPQDLTFDSDTPSKVVIGANNSFREQVTIHRSATENGITKIGDGNYFMAGSHAGHDAQIGDHNVFANGSLLGGHVTVGNHSFLGGTSAIHQFVRVGDVSMVKGVAGISRDVPPFCTVGDYNVLAGLNIVGMRRLGFSAATRKNIKKAFDHMIRSGLNLSQALETAVDLDLEPEAKKFVEFFRNTSKKGICTR